MIVVHPYQLRTALLGKLPLLEIFQHGAASLKRQVRTGASGAPYPARMYR